jgi:peptide-methionine (S)-S-oxide reductase
MSDTKEFREVSTLAGGCFWCIEAVLEQVEGILLVESGYIGGTVFNPSYELVCTGTTGHAEAVRVTFDTEILEFSDVLEIFFSVHDPTTLNRQGPDIGSQYRSAIFFHTTLQQVIAAEMIEELDKSGTWEDPIVTEITPNTNFYYAEDYHKNYYQRNTAAPYCQMMITPKLAKFRGKFQRRLRSDA